ncbi:MAG: DUF192 domain-containing protein [Endomicrobium sp.]|nr:DUF192 domain-containing protein [Endomicrobium sp.]
MKVKFLVFLAFLTFIFMACFFEQQRETETVQEKPKSKDVFSVADGTVLKVALNNNVLDLVAANSPKAKSDGLSNKEEIPEDGMIFFFYELEIQSFWMKDMKFPIDIIWVSGNEVVGIEKNVPPPPANAYMRDLEIYRSPEKADTVIELEAGMADKLNIVYGSTVRIWPN